MKWNVIRRFLGYYGTKITAAVICAAAVGTAATAYQNSGRFKPDTHTASALRRNEISLPGDDGLMKNMKTEDTEAETETETETESETETETETESEHAEDLWEKNQDAKEDKAPRNTPDAAALLENGHRVNYPEEAGSLVVDRDRQQNHTLPDNTVPATDNHKRIVYVNGEGESQTGVHTGKPGAAKPGKQVKPEPDNHPLTPQSERTGEQEPSVDQGTSPSGHKDVQDQPRKSDENKGGHTEEKQIDPDIKPKQHPSRDDGIVLPEYPQSGVEGDVPEEDLSIFVHSRDDYIGSYMQVYYGEQLSDWKILYSLDVSVQIKKQVGDSTRTQLYTVTDASDNVRIEGYPSVAGDDFEVVVSVRANENSPWISSEPEKVKVWDQKLVFVDEKGEEVGSTYLNAGDRYALYSDYDKEELIGKSEDGSQITRLFTGWSQTPGGDNVGEEFVSADKGRTVLYARPGLDVPENMQVTLDYSYVDYKDGDEGYVKILQVLDYAPDCEVLDVPYGIHKVSGLLSADRINIPSTVSDVDFGDAYIREGYSVDPDNPHLSSTEDGLLLDKEQRVLCGVPSNALQVDIPETVEQIDCAFSALEEQQVYMHGQLPADFAFNDKIGAATIWVDGDAYLDYVAAWKPTWDTMEHLRTAENEELYQWIFVDDSGAVMQELEDGRIKLCRVPDNADSSYIVPASVDIIGSNVLGKNSQVDTLSFWGRESAPIFEENAFGEGAIPTLYVPDTIAESFADALKDGYGEEAAAHIQATHVERVVTEDGFIYTVTELDGERMATLTKAPADCTAYLAEQIPEDLTLVGIENNAFSGCSQIKIVELPETVTSIGDHAFSGCAALQGVLSLTGESVHVGMDAFSDCDALRFVAFNTKNVQFFRAEDEEHYVSDEQGLADQKLLYYQAYGGDNQYMFANCASYYLLPQGDGYLLYGVALDSDDQPSDGRYLVCATTDISGEIALEPYTVEINTCAFIDCKNPFTLNADSTEDLWVLDMMSFANATGFQGNTDEPGTLYLSENMIYLENSAFYGCTGLQKVVIRLSDESWDEGIVRLPYATFANCTIKELEFAEDTQLQHIETGALTGVLAERIDLPETINNIGTNAFSFGTKMLNFNSDLPPLLSNSGSEYYFKYDDQTMQSSNDDLVILLKGKHPTENPELAQLYVDQWKYNIIGYTDYDAAYASILWDNYDELLADDGDEDLLEQKVKEIVAQIVTESEKKVRELLGLQESEAQETEDTDAAEISDETAEAEDAEELPAEETETENAGGQPVEETETENAGELPAEETETEDAGELPAQETETENAGELPVEESESVVAENVSEAEPEPEQILPETEAQTQVEEQPQAAEDATGDEPSIGGEQPASEQSSESEENA